MGHGFAVAAITSGFLGTEGRTKFYGSSFQIVKELQENAKKRQIL